MSKNLESLPIVDIEHLSKRYTPWKEEYADKFYKDPEVLKKADEVSTAFTEWGFLYLINHGIEEDVINESYQLSEKFFEIGKETKASFPRTPEFLDGGYVGYDDEILDSDRPFDIKEAYDYKPISSYNTNIDKYVPGFQPSQLKFWKVCQELAYHLLRLVSIALNIEDKEYLIKQHLNAADGKKNPSSLRFLLYPPISSDSEVLEKQLRCSEHADYGTVSLLFQDDAGGLQIVSPAGDYVNVTPIKGSIVVNSATMLDRWSAGIIKSTRHRVIIPTNGEKRRSMAFFLHPDYATQVECLDGSDTYEKITVRKWFTDATNKTYGYK